MMDHVIFTTRGANYLLIRIISIITVWELREGEGV